MSKFYPLASSSSGNCIYIGHGKSGLLVDAGISAKCIIEGLSKAAIEPSSLIGIFITHEHTDHIQGLKTFAKKFNIPVFSSKKTKESLTTLIPELDITAFEETVEIDEFKITRFSTSHDCDGSSGYVITLPDGRKCSVCTDLGYVSDEVHSALVGSDAVLLESNYDLFMLQNGSYPEHLKRRILSDKGHLSNNNCAAEVAKLIKSGTTRIILGHLSRENNRPEIASGCTAARLLDDKLLENEDYLLYVAEPKNGKVIIF